MIGALLAAITIQTWEGPYAIPYADTPLSNPYRGFVHTSTGSAGGVGPPSHLHWASFALSEVLIGPGTYDWRPVASRILQAAESGRHTILHFDLDRVGRNDALPEFLREDVDLTEYSFQRRYSRRSYAPNYESLALRLELLRFVGELGQRFGDDPRVAYVSVGLMGPDGTWHVPGQPELVASKAVQRELTAAFERAFTNTPVLVSVPAGPDDPVFEENDLRDVGYLLPRIGADPAWSLARLIEAELLSNLETRPVGLRVSEFEEGEALRFPEDGHRIAEVFGGRQDVSLAALVHALSASFVLDPAVWLGSFDRSLTELDEAYIDIVAEALGYDYQFMTYETRTDATHWTFVAELRNNGVAPLHHSVPLQVLLLRRNGAQTVLGELDGFYGPGLPPGESKPFTFAVPRGQIGNGDKVLVRMIAPGTDVPIQFSNRDMDADLDGWLTLLTVRGL